MVLCSMTPAKSELAWTCLKLPFQHFLAFLETHLYEFSMVAEMLIVMCISIIIKVLYFVTNFRLSLLNDVNEDTQQHDIV